MLGQDDDRTRTTGSGQDAGLQLGRQATASETNYSWTNRLCLGKQAMAKIPGYV